MYSKWVTFWVLGRVLVLTLFCQRGIFFLLTVEPKALHLQGSARGQGSLWFLLCRYSLNKTFSSLAPLSQLPVLTKELQRNLHFLLLFFVLFFFDRVSHCAALACLELTM